MDIRSTGMLDQAIAQSLLSGIELLKRLLGGGAGRKAAGRCDRDVFRRNARRLQRIQNVLRFRKVRIERIDGVANLFKLRRDCVLNIFDRRTCPGVYDLLIVGLALFQSVEPICDRAEHAVPKGDGPLVQRRRQLVAIRRARRWQ